MGGERNKKEGKGKIKKYRAREQCQDQTLEAGFGTWLRGGFMFSDQDTERQEDVRAMGFCVGEEREEIPNHPPFLPFSPNFQRISPKLQ